jgi:hypothetical protein
MAIVSRAELFAATLCEILSRHPEQATITRYRAEAPGHPRRRQSLSYTR